MARVDYLDDPSAPTANALVPATSAIITDEQGRILLQRRRDNNLWGLPGGTMEIGETISDCVVREVREETGLDVRPVQLIGIYSNPEHVIAFSNGEVRQEFSVCFLCRSVGGEVSVSDESYEVTFFAPDQLERLPIHPSIRQRIAHYLAHNPEPFIC
jgi:mutator protein MutT